jgi:hypothetical protein
VLWKRGARISTGRTHHAARTHLGYLQKSNGVLDIFKHVFGVRFDVTAARAALLVDSLFDAVLKSLHLIYHNLQVGVSFD